MRRIERACDTLELTEALAAAVGDLLEPGDRVALVGELGAGKTTFVRGMSRTLGADESMVSSPTFVVVNQYPCRSPRLGSGVELVHADLYRLTSAEDLDAVGWDRLTGPRSIVVAEWPDRAPGALGPAGSHAQIELVESGAAGCPSEVGCSSGMGVSGVASADDMPRHRAGGLADLGLVPLRR